MSTWAEQFLGAYKAAHAGVGQELRDRLAACRDEILGQPGGQEGIEAVEAGLDAYDANMTETEATAWAQKLRGGE